MSSWVKIYFGFLLFCVFISSTNAQQHVTISGHVTDITTKEPFINATIYLKSKKVGTATNNFGFYSLRVPRNERFVLTVSFVGYNIIEKEYKLQADSVINFNLTGSLELDEVVIHPDNYNNQQFGVVKIPVNQIKKFPILFESDLIKAFQLMPGVQNGREGNSGLYVRGGSPDQNLVLLDGVALYNVGHFGNFLSIFNTEAIKDVKLYKGGFPARYGSRLSSVMEVWMKEGSKETIQGSGSVGLFSGSISLEGPIQKGKSSYLVSARRFWPDIIFRPVSYLLFDGASAGYNFYDINAKINYDASPKNKFFVSMYTGFDNLVFRFTDTKKNSKNKTRWGNWLGALRWNHIFNSVLYSNTTISTTDYNYGNLSDYKIKDESVSKRYYSNYKNEIQDFNLRSDFEYSPLNSLNFKFGLGTTYHVFRPGTISQIGEINSTISIDTTYGSKNKTAWESFIYLENIIKPTEHLNINLGVRTSLYTIDDCTYPSFEPRITVSSDAFNLFRISASYAEMKQYVHLLSYSGAGLPNDLWVPSTPLVPPQQSKQIALGLESGNLNTAYTISFELYYKRMTGLIAYKEGASFFGGTKDWQEKVEISGSGSSKGIEIMIRKDHGKTKGWIAYTLSGSDRQFKNINFGEKFPFRYDRRHDLSFVLTHEFNKSLSFSASWIFGSGYPITLASGKYPGVINTNFLGNLNTTSIDYSENIDLYNGLNSIRMRPYHRMDIGLVHKKEKKWGERRITLSVYNLYNRQNPYFYFYDTDDNGTMALYQQSFLPFLPSISYGFVFGK